MHTSVWRSDSDRRTILLGVLAITIIAAIGKGGPLVYQKAAAATANAVAISREADLNERLIASNVDLKARAHSAVELRERLERGVIPASNPAAAATTLVHLIDGFAATAGVHISSTNIRADSVFTASYSRISVHMYAATDIVGIERFLDRVENGSYLLAVKEMTITQSDPAADDRMPEALRLEIVIEGLARHGTSIPEDVP